MKLLLGSTKVSKTNAMVNRLSDNVRVWSREQKCLEALSEDRKWRRSCDVSRQVVPYRAAGSYECANAEELLRVVYTVYACNV